LGPGIGCDGHGLILDIRTAIAVKPCGNRTGSANRDGCLGPIRGRTTARTLCILDDKRRVTRILEFVSKLYHFSFGNRTKVVVGRFELELRQWTFRFLFGDWLRSWGYCRTYSFLTLKFSEPAFQLSDPLLGIPILA